MANQKNDVQNSSDIPFGKKNYFVIIGSVVVLIIGFLLLSGGGSQNPSEFNYEMFSTRRIVIAPLVLLAGFTMAGFGIMYRFKDKQE